VRGGESEQRRSSRRKRRRGGGESYHPCVSREAAMDACDNDFASKRRREAQVQQGFRSDDNGGKEGRNAAEAEQPNNTPAPASQAAPRHATLLPL